MKRRHESHHARMATIALVAAMTFGPAVAIAAPCAGQGAGAGACTASAASAGCLYAQGCFADDARVDCPRADTRAAWLEGTCNALRCRSAQAAQVAGDWAAQRHGVFVDEDGDGVCDNSQNCSRINGDGAGFGAGNGAGAGNASGAGYGSSAGQGYGAGCEHDAPSGAGQGAHLGWCGGRR